MIGMIGRYLLAPTIESVLRSEQTDVGAPSNKDAFGLILNDIFPLPTACTASAKPMRSDVRR